jgi:hypothetical protein
MVDHVGLEWKRKDSAPNDSRHSPTALNFFINGIWI